MQHNSIMEQLPLLIHSVLFITMIGFVGLLTILDAPPLTLLLIADVNCLQQNFVATYKPVGIALPFNTHPRQQGSNLSISSRLHVPLIAVHPLLAYGPTSSTYVRSP